MILVVSSTKDEHAAAVLKELSQRGARAALLDLSLFPQHIGLSLRYTSGSRGPSHAFRLELPHNETIPLDDCRVIWWRRPQPYAVDPAISSETHRSFAYTECYEALAGMWEALDVFWVNRPTSTDVGSRKAYQLKVAQEVGLHIPETLITNNPDEVRAFVDRLGAERTIYKTFSATEQAWRETRILRQEEMALLDNVRYAPVIFQEYIEAAVDLRVTIVKEEIYAAAIHSQETTYKIDYRMDWAQARVTPHDLPEPIQDQLRALMKCLGLVYGAVDMRFTPDGRYVFLEVNPAGQWLFVSERTGQPITARFAQLLADHDR